MRHRPLKEQAARINSMLRGFFNYFAVPYGLDRLKSLSEIAVSHWRKVLSTRSQSGNVNWKKFNIILQHYPICRPIVRYSYVEFQELGNS